MKLRVAGAQIPVTEDIESNVSLIDGAIEFAAREKADILLTPEGSLSGYSPKFDTRHVEEALKRITAKAKYAGVGLALGTCFVEPDDGKCYNEIRFYAPDGTFLGFHTKTLTCGTMTETPVGEINDYAVKPLRTFAFPNAVVGGLICNDMWANPNCTPVPDMHLSQQLARMGAKVIFHAVNGGRGDDEWRDVIWSFHEASLRIRAKAGKMWIVTVDSSHPTNLKCSAPSGVINPEGAWVCRTEPKGERYFAHTIEL